LIAGVSTGFAVHQWVVSIGFVTFALIMAGVAVEAAKNKPAPPVFGSP
jgi:hypothetical protein